MTAVRACDVAACVCLVAGFVLGVASRVCGEPAERLAAAAVPALSLPPSSGVASLCSPPRSPAQDAVAAGSALVDGVCVSQSQARPVHLRSFRDDHENP